MKIRWGLVAIAYALLALAGGGLSVWVNGSNPFVHPAPRFAFGLFERHALSCALGLAFGGFVVISTRLSVVHCKWAQWLHAQLRPVAAGMATSTLLLVAVLSSLGEELVFRSLLTPLLGVWVQGFVFGLLHQVGGKSRWIWVSWAAGVGLVLGALYWLTGSLAGPVVAHAFINALNLAYLRDHRLAEAPAKEGERPVGGDSGVRGPQVG